MSLQGEDLHYRYGRSSTDAVAFDQVELSTGVTALVGVNGAGKTTLMRCLAGAREPTSGKVVIDAVDLYGAHRSTVLPKVAMMTQEDLVPADARVRDAVTYAGWMKGQTVKRAAAAATGVLDRVGLEDKRSARVGQLSGGMKRRLTLACALASSPSYLLLDEPTAGLDPLQRVAFKQLITELAESCAVLLSSHLMEDVESIADRVIVMHEGASAYQGDLNSFLDEFGGADRSAESAFVAAVTKRQA